MTALGIAKEAVEMEKETLLSIFLTRHPYLRDFSESPSTALIRVKIEKYIRVSSFQNIDELIITS